MLLRLARLIFCLVLLKTIMWPTSAMAVALDALAPYEQAMFSQDYAQEPMATRLERLELQVFGEVQAGDEAVRREHLLNVLQSVRPLRATGSGASHENTTTPSPPGENVSQEQMTRTSSIPYPRAAKDATDYPTVTALEREIFSRDFVREDIQYRLERLEKKTFGKPTPEMPLVDRVDRLLTRYPSLTPRHMSNSDSASDEVSSAIRALPSDSSHLISTSRDIYTKIDALEKYFFNGRTYPNELMTERLDRLEKVAYSQTYLGESVDRRTSRLLKSFQVQWNDNQEQPRLTAQSRPTVAMPADPAALPSTPSSVALPPYNTATGTTPPASPSTRQNVSLGTRVGERSTHQFSQEMLDMLPPDVRSQFDGSQSASSGTVLSAPTTVVIEQSRSAASGFQPYGGTPLQYYNYYGSPGSTSRKTQTTVIQPDGSASVYSTETDALPSTPGLLPNPYYVGNPGLLQTLGNLELGVYGQINTVEPVYVRLGRLEASLLGQMYPSYPDAQRLANLQKTYQLQSMGRLLGQGKGGAVGRTAGSLILGVPLTPPSIQSTSPPGAGMASPRSSGMTTSPLGVPLR